jgi:hypothetical protein
MAETEKIIFETEVKTGQSANSIKGLKGELRDLTKQLGTLDSNSDAFKQAAAKAGQLREQIRGINDAIENADPEKKFAPFVRTIGGLAGGFSAVQGAMALFGAESEDLQKTLVKVQGAMALSQGLNSMIEFKNDFADLGKLVVGNVTKAFSTLRGAIIATGIGAAAVAVGLLVANWKEFSTFVLKLIPGLETVGKFFGNIIQSVTDFVGITSQAGRELDSLNKKNLKTNETLKQQIEIWEAVGGKEKEIYNAKKQMIENDLETLRKRLKVNGELTKEELKQFKELKNNLIVEEVKYNNFVDGERTKRDEKEKERIKKFNEDAEKVQERRDEIARKRDEFNKKIEYAQSEIDRERREKLKNKETEKSLQAVDDRYAKQKERTDKLLQDELATEQTTADRKLEIIESLNTRGVYSDKQAADAKKKIADEEAQAKINNMMTVANAAAGFADLLGQQTAAGKALGVASATINTYVGASKALAQGGIFGFIGAAGIIAAGLASVRRIMAVQIPNSGGGGAVGGGGAMPTMPSTGGGTPSFNPISQGIRIQGANEPIVTRNIKTQDNRVYVLESDITKTQNTVDGIKNKAKVK